jgi:hypothetical protein
MMTNWRSRRDHCTLYWTGILYPLIKHGTAQRSDQTEFFGGKWRAKIAEVAVKEKNQ